MKKKKTIILSILLLLIGVVRGQAPLIYEHTYPDIQQEDGKIRVLMDRVAVDSLYATIDHLQSYPNRIWNGHWVYEVQDWLKGRYSGMGFDSVYLHDFQVLYHDSLWETSDNVIAFKRGLLYPDEYVVCGAHYDSYNNSPGDPDSLRAPGADDNASGVAGILETARLLSGCSFERSVLFCHWAAEEVGLKGSEAFANDCATELMDIVGYFNLDMTGYLEEGSDIHVNLMYTTRDSLIANYVFGFSRVYYPEMRIWQDWLPWGDSDYSSFNRAGYAAVHPFEDTHHSSPFIHSVSDLLGVSVNSMEQCQRFTALNLGLVATLAGLIPAGVEEEVKDSLTVFPNPASDRMTVKGLLMREVAVFDLMGQKVLKKTCHEEETVLDVSSLAAGVYVLCVTDDAMNVHPHRVVVY